MELKVGDMAPVFSAMDQTGANQNLKDYLGKKVLVYFYPKDDTPGCTREACNFRDNLEQLKEKVVVLGISGDSVTSHYKFVQKYKLNFSLLADTGSVIRTLYGADNFIFAKRSSFLIDEEGKIIKIYPKVNPDIHVQEVLRDLQI